MEIRNTRATYLHSEEIEERLEELEKKYGELEEKVLPIGFCRYWVQKGSYIEGFGPKWVLSIEDTTGEVLYDIDHDTIA